MVIDGSPSALDSRFSSQCAQGIEVVGDQTRPHRRRKATAKGLIYHRRKRFAVARHQVAEWLHVFGVGMGPTKDKRPETFRRAYCKIKSDPAAQRVSEIIGFPGVEFIQYCKYIGGAQREIVRI